MKTRMKTKAKLFGKPLLGLYLTCGDCGSATCDSATFLTKARDDEDGKHHGLVRICHCTACGTIWVGDAGRVFWRDGDPRYGDGILLAEESAE